MISKGEDFFYPALNVNGKQISDNHEQAQTCNDFCLSHSNIDYSFAGLPEDEHFTNNLGSILATDN